MVEPEAQWAQVRGLARWSDWAAFEDAAAKAPRLPGVYLFRDRRTGLIVYVGMAGEQAGSGRPQGLWGRLGVYRIGKGATSGFGEAVLDRALGDESFLLAQLERLRAGEVMRSKQWAIDAIAWWAPEVCWVVCSDRAEALSLEDAVIGALEGSELWNRMPRRSA